MAEDKSLVVKAVPAVFVSIACVTVFLRCYVRLSVVKAFGLDDGAMVLSMVRISSSMIIFGKVHIDNFSCAI